MSNTHRSIPSKSAFCKMSPCADICSPNGGQQIETSNFSVFFFLFTKTSGEWSLHFALNFIDISFPTHNLKWMAGPHGTYRYDVSAAQNTSVSS